MKNVLVVDDEMVLRMLIVDSLEELNCQVDEAENGMEAIEKINENNYDIMILDYMMPELTGIELLKKVDSESIKDTYVLMLTAKAQEKDQLQAKEAGVDYFMKKPFSPMELYQIVEELINE
ncbi:hypothetical protein GCM10008929_08650 [Alkalibacterium psychrotolerans]